MQAHLIGVSPEGSWRDRSRSFDREPLIPGLDVSLCFSLVNMACTTCVHEDNVVIVLVRVDRI